jgi:hypothetical protein
VIASNAEYGVVKEFGVWEKTPGDRPTLINARTIPVGV